jgi:hypothetical protein
MQSFIKPKPTKYDRVEFRSKSEAIFAVALNQTPNLIWVYEPEIECFDFLIDFWVICESEHKGFFSNLFEYKPSKPSDEYIMHAFECFERFKLGGSNKARLITDLKIFWGSPFREEDLQGVAFGESDISHNLVSMNANWRLAREYRFDLAGDY